MTWTRRDLLALGLSSWAMSRGLGRSALAQAPRPRAGPRYVVLIQTLGGVDAIFTTAPKRKREVADGVDLPYAPAQIRTRGGLEVGPHMAPLLDWGTRMAVVHGVQVQTANHYSGKVQLLRLRTGASPIMPTICEAIGSVRDGQPLGALTIGDTFPMGLTGGWFGSQEPVFRTAQAPEMGLSPDRLPKGLLGEIDRASPADLQAMAAVLRRKSAAARTHIASGRGDRTAENMNATAALFERLPNVPRFAPAKWGSGAEVYMGFHMQRILWALEHDLTRALSFQLPDDWNWDSHVNNLANQKSLSEPFFASLGRFLGELDRRSNAHGRLADNTLVLVMSELGRFPWLNSFLGKDHLPEAPLLAFGPHVNTAGGAGAMFGATGRSMEAPPVSLRTGRPDAKGRRVTLDDVGATVLALAGLDPRPLGYRGQVLDFLLA